MVTLDALAPELGEGACHLTGVRLLDVFTQALGRAPTHGDGFHLNLPAGAIRSEDPLLLGAVL